MQQKWLGPSCADNAPTGALRAVFSSPKRVSSAVFVVHIHCSFTFVLGSGYLSCLAISLGQQ